MKFVMEFAENLMLRMMEDPKERDRRFREHLYAGKRSVPEDQGDVELPAASLWVLDLRPPQFPASLGCSNQSGAWSYGPHDELLQQSYDNSK